jgi:hypothetical protein
MKLNYFSRRRTAAIPNADHKSSGEDKGITVMSKAELRLTGEWRMYTTG